MNITFFSEQMELLHKVVSVLKVVKHFPRFERHHPTHFRF